MATGTTGTTTADLLRLAQWTNATFPTSSYAYSHGLETAVAEGRVTDAASCEGWIAAVLRHGAGAVDAWAIRAVLGGDDPRAVAATLRARAGCAERWEEARDQGRAFADTVGQSGGDALPVALARAARGMDARTVVAFHLHAFATQLVSAAQRLTPLGQGDAQRILAAMHPVIEAIATTEWDGPPGSAALVAERDAMRHEILQPRMFRT